MIVPDVFPVKITGKPFTINESTLYPKFEVISRGKFAPLTTLITLSEGLITPLVSEMISTINFCAFTFTIAEELADPPPPLAVILNVVFVVNEGVVNDPEVATTLPSSVHELALVDDQATVGSRTKINCSW